MSYIRCLSNPEGLYIVGTKSGIEIYQGDIQPRYMPFSVFEGILKAWIDVYENGLGVDADPDDDNPIEYKGATLSYANRDGEWKWRLKYKDWHIDMWETTMYYLAYSNQHRWKEARHEKTR